MGPNTTSTLFIVEILILKSLCDSRSSECLSGDHIDTFLIDSHSRLRVCPPSPNPRSTLPSFRSQSKASGRQSRSRSGSGSSAGSRATGPPPVGFVEGNSSKNREMIYRS